MLLVDTYVGPSRIHGLGLFAAQDIPAGTVLWRFIPPFDVLFGDRDLEALPEFTRDTVMKYSYFDAVRAAYVLCGDDARFMNHSDLPNTREELEQTVAVQDIAAGEEITCDYREFDSTPPERVRGWRPNPRESVPSA